MKITAKGLEVGALVVMSGRFSPFIQVLSSNCEVSLIGWATGRE